jgi:hypothetical protein
MHNKNTFDARMKHGQTWTYKTHRDSDLGKATTYSLIIFFVFGHRANIQMSFCPRTPKCES